MFSWLGELVFVFWLLELDLCSLKGSAVSSSRFWGVYGINMSSGSPSGVGNFKYVYFHRFVEVASQHIFPAASSLLVPGIFASASLPWSHPALQAKVCWVGACVDLFLAPRPCPLHHRDVCRLLLVPQAWRLVRATLRELLMAWEVQLSL